MSAFKTLAATLSLSVSLSLYAQTVSVEGSYRITDRGPHHRVWTRTQWETNRLGQTLARTNSYIEIASGLHYTNGESGHWEESNPAFELNDDGYAVARRCQHQVVVTPNLNPDDGVVIDLRTPDGQRLRSGILGLNLFDPVSGNSLQIGAIREVVGTLVSSNAIVWFDAFEGLRADVRIRNEPGEFHQDVLLRERLSAAQLEQLGFDAATVRLEVWTEFLEAPSPGIETVVVRSETNQTVRAQMMAPDQVDQRLDFGAMRMDTGSGTAFVEPASGNTARILKEWREIGGRRFLIESATYEELAPLLDSLPLKTASLDLQSHSGRMLATRTPPTRSHSGASAGEHTIKLARADMSPSIRTVVLDYQLATSQPDFTFRGDTTYYVDSLVNLSGTTTIEGGTVVKYSPSSSARIVLNGPLACRTAAYRPAIFTARDDDTVGEIIFPYSDGNPNGEYFGVAALTLATGVGNSASLTDLRVCYLRTAIISLMPGYATLSCTNSQIVKCQNGVYLYNNNRLNLRNALFTSLQQSAIYDASYYNYSFVDAQHVTFNQVGYLASRYGAWGVVLNMNLTNCVIASVSQWSAPGQSSVAWSGDPNGFWNNGASAFGSAPIICPNEQNPFQTVGAGSHYLADTTPPFRNAGTGLINPGLALALKGRTTFPPTEITANITGPQVLSKQPIRDTDTLDLGYHYDPLDWAVNYIAVSPGVTVTLQSGVAVGFYGGLAGFQLGNGARLESQGGPVQRVSLARYTTVQEQPMWWARAGSQTGLAYLWGQPTAACQVSLSETDIYLAGAKWPQDYLASVTGSGLVSLSHCQVFGGRLNLTPYYETQFTVQWFNNLFWRTSLELQDYQSPWRAINLTAYNNLFYRGSLVFQHDYYASWELRDNAFDGVGLTVGGIAWSYNRHNNNGYINTPVLPGSYGGDVSLTSFAYQDGPCGSFYQQSTAFIDQGSRTAAAAGLANHTTKTDQTPDSSAVDIGYHYPIISPPTTCTDDQGLCVNGVLPLCGSDPQGLPVIFITVQAPAHGTLGYDQAGNFVYTPTPCYSGVDSFAYKVNNGYLDSSADTVTVTMSTTVTANPDDSKQTCKNTALSFSVTGSDSCSLALTYALVGNPPPNAQFTLATDGSVNFTPANGYCGSVSFQFRAVNQCGQVSAPATVTITVGKKPTADSGETRQTCRNTTLNFNLGGSDPCGAALTFALVSGPTHAQAFTLSPNGTVSYTPANGHCGPDSFEFKVSNGCQDSDPVTVNIAVGKKPSASSVTVWTCKNTPLNFTLTGTDPCDLTPQFALVSGSGPTHAASFSLAPNGSVSYTPEADFTGDDSFQFKILGECEDSDPTTVTIHVDQTPVAYCQNVLVKKGESITFNLSADGAAPLTFALVPGTGPDQAQAFSLSANGQVTYTPVSTFEGTDGFDFTVNSCGQDASAHVTIYVTPGTDLTADCRPRSVLLTWDMATVEQLFGSGFADAGFNVYRSTTSGGPYTWLTPTPLNSATRTFADTSVVPGMSYYYVVTFLHTANNCDGSQTTYESPYSNEVGPISTCCPPSNDPFWTDYGATAQELAEWIMAGSGITVVPNSATYTGAAVAKGTFGNGSDADLPIISGVILSSGDIALAKGPNDQLIASKSNTGIDGDSDLESLVPGLLTLDAAVLEFDITSPIATNISFEYFFASEEYSEWIGEFNDIVAIFVQPHNGVVMNVALVPGTSEPIAVNTIHNGNDAGTIPPHHPEYFESNLPATLNVRYDGLTTGDPTRILTTTEAQIPANVSYHIKIAIADAAGPLGTDRILDSAVFIKAEIPCP